MEKYFHLISYASGFAAFAAIYLMARPGLNARGQRTHLLVLLVIHFFRYFGLTALLPGVFDLRPVGFTHEYLTQIAVGDYLTSILALVAFFALLYRQRFAIALVWGFNIFGTLDYLNAAVRVTPSIQDPNILGPFGWFIMTVFLPAWLISHIAVFFVLARREHAMEAITRNTA